MDENNNIPQQPEGQPVPQEPVAPQPQAPVAPQAPYAAPQAPYAPQQPAYPQPGMLMTPPPGAKGKSIAALVLGIVSAVFCWFGWFSIIALAMGVVGIILGIKGRNECPLGYQGHGMATAGLVLAIIGTVLSGIGVACWICVLATAGSLANELAGELSHYY